MGARRRSSSRGTNGAASTTTSRRRRSTTSGSGSGSRCSRSRRTRARPDRRRDGRVLHAAAVHLRQLGARPADAADREHAQLRARLRLRGTARSPSPTSTRAKTYGHPFGFIPETYPGWPPGTRADRLIGAGSRLEAVQSARGIDQRVDGDAAVRGRRSTGFTSSAVELIAQVGGEDRQARDGVGERVDVGGVRPAHAVEQRPDPQPVDQRARPRLVQRREREAAIARASRPARRRPPTRTSGPNCGSRTIPSASSTPGGAIAATTTRGPSRAARSS